MLTPLAPDARRRLVAALAEARALLDPDAAPRDIAVRAHRSGDIGWIISRQAALYAEDFGFDASFEALLAEIGAGFVKSFDASREACWIAERDGVILGSVTLVRQDDAVAKLRMLYVEAAARGSGLGRRLVEQCIDFARAAGYRRITLWTNDILLAARRLYAATGFVLVDAEPPALAFGRMMASETWERGLD
jgi:GNAT superfamily N-acetyltransferase